jgi:hypothetical protein
MTTLEGNVGPVHIKSWMTGGYSISSYENGELKKESKIKLEVHLNIIITHANGKVQVEKIILDSVDDPAYKKYNPDPI